MMDKSTFGPKLKSNQMRVLLKSIILFSTTVILTACSSSGQKPAEKDVIVNAYRATEQNCDSRKEFAFIAKPFRVSELSFRVGGPIEHFDLYVGNHYTQGATIASIDQRDFTIRNDRARSLYDQAQAEYQRIEALYQKNNVSASTYDKAKAEYKTSQAAYKTTTNELKDTRLAAPFNGYIGAVYIEKHQDVKAAEPVVSFVDIDRLKIELYVTQEIASRAEELKQVDLFFDNDPRKHYKAQVVEIARTTTKNNLSYLMTAILPNADGKLLAGMSGKVFFDMSDKEMSGKGSTVAIAIPQRALCHRPTVGDYLWVVDEQTMTVSRRKVTLSGLAEKGMVNISGGINKGEVVAISSLRFLSDDMPVKIGQFMINNSIANETY